MDIYKIGTERGYFRYSKKVYPGLTGSCKQPSSGSDIGGSWSLHILKNSKNYPFFNLRFKHLIKDEGVNVLKCGLCTESNIEKKLKERDRLDYTDKDHKVVLGRAGEFKVQCRNRKHKFFYKNKLIRSLDLTCEEDNSKSFAITIDFKYSEMPECLGKKQI